MPMYNIPDPATVRREIEASYERCQQYGVNPEETRNPRQKRLTSEQLAQRLELNKEFLDIAAAQMEELYQFVAGAGFAVNIADRDGYILHDIGDKPILDELSLGNCCPGYRWTEKDVGTSVISLALEREMPVQINDDEHFCRRGYGHTCSAAPVFDPQDQLIGVIAMSGNADQVHPHTLGMVITAAHAIKTQLRIQKTSQELRLQNNYMRAIIDSIDSGVMAIDENRVISKINDQGNRILQWHAELEGKPLAEIIGSQIDIEAMMNPDFEFVDRELFIQTPNKTVQLICTAKPIFDANGRMQGFIIVFNEIKRLRRLVNKMAGTQARFTFDDIVITSCGLSPLVELAQLAGCPLHYFPEMGGWVPVHSDRFETPQAGLFIAGSISGVEGAGVAEIQGRIAGLMAADYLKLADRKVLERDIHKHQKDIFDVRQAAIPFYPQIEAGRQRMNRIWHGSTKNPAQ